MPTILHNQAPPHKKKDVQRGFWHFIPRTRQWQENASVLSPFTSLTTRLPLTASIFSRSCNCPRRRRWQPTPVLLPGKSHGWRSLVGCSSWGHEELDMTEQLCFRFSLSCIGEGNGNPLQCPCLENLRDGEAWCAAVFGVAQSRTRLKRLSSSSSSSKSLLENLPQIFVQVYRFQWVMMQRQ